MRYRISSDPFHTVAYPLGTCQIRIERQYIVVHATRFIRSVPFCIQSVPLFSCSVNRPLNLLKTAKDVQSTHNNSNLREIEKDLSYRESTVCIQCTYLSLNNYESSLVLKNESV